MGTYRDNTPNYNVNKVVKFTEFDKEIQKKETEDFKRGFVKNSQNNQIIKNSKLKFNDKTGKMDDVTLSEVDDKLKSLKESTSSESLEILQKLTQYLEDHPENLHEQGASLVISSLATAFPSCYVEPDYVKESDISGFK